jgi:hypothetical protein
VMSQDIADARTHRSWVRAFVISGLDRVGGRLAGSSCGVRARSRSGMSRARTLPPLPTRPCDAALSAGPFRSAEGPSPS